MIETLRSYARAGLACFILAVVFGATAIPAQAGDYGPGRAFGPAEEAAWAEADFYWKRQPGLCTTITREVVAPGALGEEIRGRATMPEEPRACSVWIVEGLSPVELCSVMRHEYAHLLGYDHDDPEMATMPACEDPEAPAYQPPDDRVVSRRQAWELWHEWQIGCYREEPGSKARRKCFRGLRRYSKKMRRVYGSGPTTKQ